MKYINKAEFINEYRTNLSDAIASAEIDNISKLYVMVEQNAGYPLYLFGNGGSAAIADHWCCDINKGAFTDTQMKMRAISLCSNGPLMTAISNDLHYAQVFANQLEYMHPTYGEGLAIAISSSGKSANILLGLRKAQEKGLRTAALVGFDGGAVLELGLAEHIIHVKSNNYGVVEDAHMAILHMVSQMLRIESSKGLFPKL